MAGLTPEQEQLAQRMAEICGYQRIIDGTTLLGYLTPKGNLRARNWRPFDNTQKGREQAEMVVQAMMGMYENAPWKLHLNRTRLDCMAAFYRGLSPTEAHIVSVDGNQPSLATCLAAEKVVYGG